MLKRKLMDYYSQNNTDLLRYLEGIPEKIGVVATQ
nr:hypothetical protein [uncultured archaeon]